MLLISPVFWSFCTNWFTVIMELLYIIIIILCFFLLFQFVEELQLWVSSHRLWTQKTFRHLSSAVMSLKRVFLTVCVVDLRPSPAATVYDAVCSWTCVWRLHLFVSGAKASTLQPASASWPERRMNGSEWIWSEPLWRLFVLKVLNWLTSGRLWMWGREFCSAHSRKQNCDLNWRGNFPVLMSSKRTVYSLWCQRKGPVVTYISRDYRPYGGHVQV